MSINYLYNSRYMHSWQKYIIETEVLWNNASKTEKMAMMQGGLVVDCTGFSSATVWPMPDAPWMSIRIMSDPEERVQAPRTRTSVRRIQALRRRSVNGCRCAGWRSQQGGDEPSHYSRGLGKSNQGATLSPSFAIFFLATLHTFRHP